MNAGRCIVFYYHKIRATSTGTAYIHIHPHIDRKIEDEVYMHPNADKRSKTT